MFLLFFALVGITCANYIYDGQQVIKYEMEEEYFLPFMKILERESAHISYDIWREKRVGNNKVEFDIQVDSKGTKERLEKLAIAEQHILIFKGYIHEDLGKDIRENLNENAKAKADPTFFDAFRTLDEINAFLEDLVLQFPGFVNLFSIGTSIEGREINAVTLTSPSGSNKPQIVYNSCQHAREWISPMTTTYIAYYLLNDYPTNSTIQALLDNFEYTIIPVVNVDGYVFTWTNERLWRKNRRADGTCHGVDNNRNWGYEWGLNSGSSGNQCSETYRGTSAFSEPENTAVANYISSLSNPVGYIDFHSYGYDFVWAWGYSSALPPNNAEMKTLGVAFADAVEQVHGSVFTTGNSNTAIYPTSGSAPDWTFGEENIIYSYTCELRGNSFIIPPDEIIISGSEIFAGVVTMGLYLLNL